MNWSIEHGDEVIVTSPRPGLDTRYTGVIGKVVAEHDNQDYPLTVEYETVNEVRGPHTILVYIYRDEAIPVRRLIQDERIAA